MKESKATARKTFDYGICSRIPRGEVWVGEAVLRHAGYEDDVEGRTAFCRHMGMDLLVLSLAEEAHIDEAQGYRYFTLEEISSLSEIRDLSTAVTVDGPFQRLTTRKGLMEVLSLWSREENHLESAWAEETERVDRLIRSTESLGLDAVILADDIASGKTTFCNPKEIQEVLFPFYRNTAALIHQQTGTRALFHSCGNIGSLVPGLLNCGFEGLAACQDNALNLLSLKEREGSRMILMGGIDGELLQSQTLSLSQKAAFSSRMQHLAEGGGFIFATSCGLYSADFLKRLQEFYDLLDGSCAVTEQ